MFWFTGDFRRVLSVDIVFLFVFQECLHFLPHALILKSGKGSTAALSVCWRTFSYVKRHSD